jgi:hypothetical protein
MRDREITLKPAPLAEADARTRTGDPFITSEVLYQLSYVGSAARLAAPSESRSLAAQVI